MFFTPVKDMLFCHNRTKIVPIIVVTSVKDMFCLTSTKIVPILLSHLLKTFSVILVLKLFQSVMFCHTLTNIVSTKFATPVKDMFFHTRT